MISLVFVRHGDAESVHAAVSDHGRALTPKGRAKVAKVAADLMGLNVAPDRIVSSDATRARQTTEILLETFGQCQDVAFQHSFYHLDYEKLLEELSGIEGQGQCLFLVGHNPGWSEIVSLLVGREVHFSPGDAFICRYKGSEALALSLTKMHGWELFKHLSS